MFKNYIKTAWRSLDRNRFYASINVLGLAVGLTCFILILLFVRDELSYDLYHTKSDRIFRVCEKIDLEGQGENSSSNPFPTGPAMLNDYPHLIEKQVRFFNFQEDKLSFRIASGNEGEDKKFREEDVFFADSTTFDVFDFPLAKGNPAEALNGPNKMILSQELADKFFPGEDPIGKTVLYDGGLPLEISGILGEIPAQSHFQIRGLISFATLRQMMGGGLTNNWVWNPNWTYLLLKEGVDPQELEDQFPAFVQKYAPEFMKGMITHYLQPLKDIHLTSALDYEIEPNSKKSNIFVFTIIGIFILLIACVNFMNLATARSARRAQEVGVRKVLGARRGQLITQFLGESVMISLIAGALSLLFVNLLMPVFNQLAGKSLVMGDLWSWEFMMMLVGIITLVGLVAGLYPAFFLSSFQPVKVMKGKMSADRFNRIFRKGLVVIQFAISLGLIIATGVIYLQYKYMQAADPGFHKDHVMIIPAARPTIPKYELFKEDLKRDAHVLEVSKMNEIIGVHHNVHEYNFAGMKDGEWIYFPSLIVDEDFVKTMGLEIIAGRDFDKSNPTDDTLGVIINETMVRERGWDGPADALNRQFYTPRGHERVIGVVKDFHAVSLLDPIRPFVLDMIKTGAGAFFTKNYVLRIRPANLRQTLAHCEEAWNKVAPNHPFEYSFLNEQIDKLYADQNRLAKLIGYFSVLAVLIACSGLFALASFSTEQRTKEIGVRKVMGASIGQIFGMLAWDFIKLVLIGSVLAFGLAAFFLYDWLQGFAFHMDMPWWIYLASAVLVGLLALLTVGFQAYKAGSINPAMALKDE